MADVVSLPARRARLDHARFLALQAEFQRLGYLLQPLTETTWDLQDRIGCRRALNSLDEADRLLKWAREQCS